MKKIFIENAIYKQKKTEKLKLKTIFKKNNNKLK